MEILRSIKALKEYRFNAQQHNLEVGFVPTMGALHTGHLSLLQKAKSEKDICIVSIFVNPTQFNDLLDFKHYPKTEESDIHLLERNNCDAVFLPSVEEIYPKTTSWTYKIGFLDSILEGAHRPNHFNGVTQIVHLLLDMIQPHSAYFGLKDYQQYLVIKDMVDQLNVPVEIIGCPTIRNTKGLALSSRNQRLDSAALIRAEQINCILFQIKSAYHYKNRENLEIEARTMLHELVDEIDYVAIKNANTLTPIHSADEKAIILIAVKVGGIRLIDNLFLN